jgi:hypothetical protein
VSVSAAHVTAAAAPPSVSSHAAQAPLRVGRGSVAQTTSAVG